MTDGSSTSRNSRECCETLPFNFPTCQDDSKNPKCFLNGKTIEAYHFYPERVDSWSSCMLNKAANAVQCVVWLGQLTPADIA